MAIEHTMATIQAEDDLRHARQVATAIRNILVHARCRKCDEQIGDEEFELTDDEEQEIVHARCNKET